MDSTADAEMKQARTPRTHSFPKENDRSRHTVEWTHERAFAIDILRSGQYYGARAGVRHAGQFFLNFFFLSR